MVGRISTPAWLRPSVLLPSVLLVAAACGERTAPVEAPSAPPALQTRPGPPPTPMPPPGTGARPAIASGDLQSARAGQALPQPLAVRVLDVRQLPVAGATIAWQVTAGGGTLAQAATTTDAEGYARASLVLGAQAVPNVVRAALGTTAVAPAVTFTAFGLPATMTLLRVVGDGQTIAPGQTLPQTVAVRVVGPNGLSVPGARVQWSASSGGAVQSFAAVTGVDGVAAGRWTLGPTLGTQTATASLVGAAPMTFTAQAVPGATAPVTALSFGLGPTWLEPGEFSAVYGVALDASSRAVPSASFTWTVDTPGIIALQVRATGHGGTSRVQITALAPGEVRLTATAGGLSRTLTFRVYPTGGRPRGG